MIRIIKFSIAGMLGAIIAWAIMEWTPLMPDAEVSVPYTYIFIIGLVSGLFIGLALGIANGISGISPRDAVKSALIGAAVGACGGILGLTFGNAAYDLISNLAGGTAIGPGLPSNIPTAVRPSGVPTPVKFLMLLFGRGFGWSLIGMFIGLSQGIATSSIKKMVNGAIGGLIGGGLGGCLFEIMKWMNLGGISNFPTESMRFLGFAITGFTIGLFISVIEEFAKQAWLIKLVGRNEGKELSLYKQETIIGRSEFADIPIFTDPDVSERHAIIRTIGKKYYIEDAGSVSGVSLNGNKISKEPLKDGDMIVIGKTRFQFRDKATARAYVPISDSFDTGVRIPTSSHVCQFCGAIKDANGNCDCTVSSAPSPVQNIPQQSSQTQMPSNPFNATQQNMGQITQPDPFSGQTAQFGASSSPSFIATSGPYSPATFPLKPGGTIIGRDATKDIPLSQDNTVSREHARVTLEAGRYILYDNNSTNGTFVNGNKINRWELNAGDLIQIGSTKFRFEA